MSRSIFGWSYPPGAANDPSAPYNQDEPPCEVCGNFVDDCICPECAVCGTVGCADCYAQHGMTRSAEQIASLAQHEKDWAQGNADESAYWRDIATKDWES